MDANAAAKARRLANVRVIATTATADAKLIKVVRPQEGHKMADNQQLTQEQQEDVQKIKDFAQHIREEVAEAKATGVKEGSATAKHIESEVELIKKEASKYSPSAFADIKGQTDYRDDISE